MASQDSIEVALNSPIDWAKFEALTAELLQQDDFPRLRKIGGRGDFGVDAVDVAFFKDESRTEAVIQVTAQRTQIQKFKKTISRLREAGIEFEQFVLVFRQPVYSGVRTQILQEAFKLGILTDIRDQSYLIGQLSKPGNNIFSRYFEDIGTQVKALLGAPDPLQITTDATRHAILASLGAYVLYPHAQIARRTLFEKTVLAVVTALGDCQIADIITELTRLMPEESITEERLRPAIDSLRSSKDINLSEDKITPSAQALSTVGRIIAGSSAAYEGLRDYVLEQCREKHTLDDASKGFLERNIRRAMLSLLRSFGPIEFADNGVCLSDTISEDLLSCLGSDLPGEVARTALIAFGAYVEDENNSSHLASLARTYASLVIRNLDPLGRNWQKSTLSRSILALDTDAVLNLLITELPEHQSLLAAARAMQDAGVKIVASAHVIDETLGHIERADRSYSRFRYNLLRMSPSMVDSQVWHAVVRGFYYAANANPGLQWTQYKLRYYDARDPERFLRFSLGRNIEIDIADLDDIPQAWFSELEEIADAVHEKKEINRKKAEFRNDEDMKRRAYDDVRMAMHLANYETQSSTANAKGYLVSEDRGYLTAQNHKKWPPRPKILILTKSLPELSAFICGVEFHDNQLIRLLFSPALSAAASLMKEEINTLTSLGVNLKSIGLQRLEWELSSGLYEAVQGYNGTGVDDKEARMNGALHLLDMAEKFGFSLDPAIKNLASSYDAQVKESEKSAIRQEELEELVRRLALSAGTTKKARRRVNSVLREIGLDYKNLAGDDEDDEE